MQLSMNYITNKVNIQSRQQDMIMILQFWNGFDILKEKRDKLEDVFGGVAARQVIIKIKSIQYIERGAFKVYNLYYSI